jgi:hypothetical protein
VAKNSVSDWDTDPDNNTDVGGIAVTNAQTADKIDDIVREVMAQIAQAVADNTLAAPPDAATTSASGIVELATVAEALAGTDAVRAVTPAGLYYPTGHLSGATIINNAGSAANKIDVAAGTARDSTDTANIALAAAITAKDITAAWAVGSTAGLLDTGSVANTTYYVYLIKRPDTGVVDVIASTSSSAPTLPTNYTLYRRIGYFIRASAANGIPLNLNNPAIEYAGAAPVFACRAWVNFNGTGTVAIRGSGNVSSITDNGTGDWTVNFTTSMSDANYGISIGGGSATGGLRVPQAPYTTAPSVSALRVGGFTDAGSAIDLEYVSVAIFR